MGEATAMTKAIYAVAIAATVALVGVVIFFLVNHALESDARADRAEAQLQELTTQNRGPQGPEGDPGRAPTADEIAAAVADYCAQNDGCRGPQGQPGAAGKNGVNGQSIQGPAGANGLGITKVVCNGTSISFFAGSTLVGTVAMVCLG